MVVDKKTKPEHLVIIIDNNKEYLKYAKKQSEEEGFSDDGKDYLDISLGEHIWSPEEYYFDQEGNIKITGEMKSNLGNTYVSISMPLSDEVLVDILIYGIKKLNKFKTALESLK